MQPNVVFFNNHIGCFYLANSRQMQLNGFQAFRASVVFTFQTAGRCNTMVLLSTHQRLFLPFKQQADATLCLRGAQCNSCFYLSNSRQMQLSGRISKRYRSCFYLSNSRQMQLGKVSIRQVSVVFTFQTAGRCNSMYKLREVSRLFLPCKQQADATIILFSFTCC